MANRASTNSLATLPALRGQRGLRGRQQRRQLSHKRYKCSANRIEVKWLSEMLDRQTEAVLDSSDSRAQESCQTLLIRRAFTTKLVLNEIKFANKCESEVNMNCIEIELNWRLVVSRTAFLLPKNTIATTDCAPSVFSLAANRTANRSECWAVTPSHWLSLALDKINNVCSVNSILI